VLVIPASHQELIKALKKDLIDIFVEAGCLVLNPGCGPCLGAHQGVLADSFIYLASPATVAASALEGKITDPRKYWS